MTQLRKLLRECTVVSVAAGGVMSEARSVLTIRGTREAVTVTVAVAVGGIHREDGLVGALHLRNASCAVTVQSSCQQVSFCSACNREENNV